MKARLFWLVSLLLTGSLVLTGCAETMIDGEGEVDKPDETAASPGGKQDAWDWRNDPTRFDGQFNYHLADLPREGRAAEGAWPSTYWPTYEDSIQVRWQGSSEGHSEASVPNWLSAAEKYDLAFNGWTLPEGHESLRPFDRDRPGTDYWDAELYYILELDGDGKIIGGEWISEQRPDFLWNPRRITRSSVPNLDIENVRMLIQMSRQPVGDRTSVTGEGGIDIPDNDPNGIVARARVADSQTIGGVQVELNITHSWRGDLMVVLAHNGAERTVHNREGGSADNLNTTITVPGFESVDAQGTWELRVSDHAGQDVGRLSSWALHFLSGSGGGDTGGGTGSAETFAGEGDVSIPDAGDFVRSTAVVPDDVEGRRVEVSVNIEHTWIGDLTVVVEKDGRRWTLHDQTGGDQDDLSTSLVLDPAPERASGEYTLLIKDSARYDTGRVVSWAVTVQ